MFDELVDKIRREQATFDFELARTLDVYRLKHLLIEHSVKMAVYNADAMLLVDELEGLDDAD